MKEKNKGITLIALIITIIVMLILVSVTISMAINGGLFEKAGKAVGDTKNAIDAEQKLADGRIKIGDKWYASIDDYLNNKPIIKPKVGDFVEYGVSYTDAYIGKEYTTTNGWRLLDYTENDDGTISDVKLISTGIPAKLYYYYDDTTNNKSWWKTDPTELTRFKDNVLGSDYVTYGDANETFSNYPGLQASAGMYYNFGDIKFAYGTSNRGESLGYFTKITSNETTYDSNNTIETTGTNLFVANGTNATVRLLTLPELNKALGRSDIDSTNSISDPTGAKGLFVLQNLKNVSGMGDYSYSSTGYYWLASPYPRASFSIYVCNVNYNGNVYNYYDIDGGVRPSVCLTSNVHYRVEIQTDSETGMDYYTLTAE